MDLTLTDTAIHETPKRSERGAAVRLLGAMARIGLVGFGGGNALVPVIEREVVGEDGLVSKEEIDREVVVANITPGALPVEVASGIGRKVAGARGMVASALAMALPGALLTLVALVLFSIASGPIVQQVRFASVGVALIIVYVLFGYTKGAVCARPAHSHERRVALGLVVVVFLLTCAKSVAGLFGVSSLEFPTLSTLDVLGVVFFAIFYTQGRFFRGASSPLRALIAGAIALVYLLSVSAGSPFAAPALAGALRAVMVVLAVWGFAMTLRSERGSAHRFPFAQLLKEASLWVVFMVVCCLPALLLCPEAPSFIGHAVLSALMSFGGGDAYLVFGQGVFVDTGLISSEDYFECIVTISNAMPGSIICKVLTGVGYIIGLTGGTSPALAMAAAGLSCGVGISGLTFLVVSYIYDEFEQLSVFDAIRRYIRPVIGGLLLTVALTMVSLNLSVALDYRIGVPTMPVLSLVVLALIIWLDVARGKSLGMLIIVAIAVSLIACNALTLV